MQNANIYHIDANVILNYIINDNIDLYNVVKNKIIFRKTWGNDIYRINIHAPGEIFRRIIVKGSFDPEFLKKLRDLHELSRNHHLEFIRIDELKLEFRELMVEVFHVERLFFGFLRNFPPLFVGT